MFHINNFCFLNESNFIFCTTEDGFPKVKENGDHLKHVLYRIDSKILYCSRICSSFSVKEEYRPRSPGVNFLRESFYCVHPYYVWRWSIPLFFSFYVLNGVKFASRKENASTKSFSIYVFYER